MKISTPPRAIYKISLEKRVAWAEKGYAEADFDRFLVNLADQAGMVAPAQIMSEGTVYAWDAMTPTAPIPGAQEFHDKHQRKVLDRLRHQYHNA